MTPSLKTCLPLGVAETSFTLFAYIGVIQDNIGIMEKKMGTTIVYGVV